MFEPLLYPSESRNVQVEIYHRGFHILVAQAGFDFDDRTARREHSHCAPVAKAVDRIQVCQPFGGQGSLQMFVANPIDPVPCQSRAPKADEQAKGACRRRRFAMPIDLDDKRFGSAVFDFDLAKTSALSQNRQGIVSGVERIEIQVRDFRRPGPGIVEQLEHAPVRKPKGLFRSTTFRIAATSSGYSQPIGFFVSRFWGCRGWRRRFAFFRMHKSKHGREGLDRSKAAVSSPRGDAPFLLEKIKKIEDRVAAQMLDRQRLRFDFRTSGDERQKQRKRIAVGFRRVPARAFDSGEPGREEPSDARQQPHFRPSPSLRFGKRDRSGPAVAVQHLRLRGGATSSFRRFREAALPPFFSGPERARCLFRT